MQAWHVWPVPAPSRKSPPPEGWDAGPGVPGLPAVTARIGVEVSDHNRQTLKSLS